MKKDEGQQMAVVYFEQESAAKTAILLSQAVVGDYPIQVESYFKAGGEEPINNTAETDKEINPAQENKSVSHVTAELLASGYILTESVVAKVLSLTRNMVCLVG